MDKPVRVALSGLGGYGNQYYLGYLLDAADERVSFVGGVDPSPERCKRLDELHARGVPVFGSLEHLYAEAPVDMLCIAAPHHYHADQTCFAVEHGSHVLCEKPLCPTLEEARRMATSRDRCGRAVAIGYQWSHAHTIQALKADIQSGALGAPRRLKTLVRWPRGNAYYTRNGWAGRIRTDQGRVVLDSPLMNATAHFLHNMLYVLGPAADRSAMPCGVTAELYRVNPIENYDTAAVRCTVDCGAELLFLTTHATEGAADMQFEYEFEHAIVRYTNGTIVAEVHDGACRDYGSPDRAPHAKIERMVDVALGRTSVVCGIEAAASHLMVALGVQRCTAVTPFPPRVMRDDGERRWVEGLGSDLGRCYQEGMLPAEMGLPWAVSGGHMRVDAPFGATLGAK